MKYLGSVRGILERASARETAVRVAAGALSQQLLGLFGITVFGFVLEMEQIKTSPQSGEFSRYPGSPRMPRGDRDLIGISAANRFYATADGWIAVDCVTLSQIGALCAFAGAAASAEAFAEAPREGEAAARVAAKLAACETAEVVRTLLAMGVPAAPAMRTDDMYQNAWFIENNFWEDYDLPGSGPVRGLRAYARWSRSAGAFARPAPLHAAHTFEVLAEAGIGAARLEDLQAMGAVKGRG